MPKKIVNVSLFDGRRRFLSRRACHGFLPAGPYVYLGYTRHLRNEHRIISYLIIIYSICQDDYVQRTTLRSRIACRLGKLAKDASLFAVVCVHADGVISVAPPCREARAPVVTVFGDSGDCWVLWNCRSVTFPQFSDCEAPAWSCFGERGHLILVCTTRRRRPCS